MYPERSIRAAALFLAGLALSFTLASCMDVGDDGESELFRSAAQGSRKCHFHEADSWGESVDIPQKKQYSDADASPDPQVGCSCRGKGAEEKRGETAAKPVEIHHQCQKERIGQEPELRSRGKRFRANRGAFGPECAPVDTQGERKARHCRGWGESMERWSWRDEGDERDTGSSSCKPREKVSKTDQCFARVSPFARLGSALRKKVRQETQREDVPFSSFSFVS